MKPLVVQKFGGTSVADPDRIRHVARRVAAARKDHRVVVVVSAMGHTTDRLIELARKVHSDPPRRELDMLLATGEQQSIALVAMALESLGLQAISFTGGQIGIHTDSAFTKARIRRIENGRILEELRKDRTVIVAGFQGVDQEENITTLGRGGSDLTAVALAAALKADLCEIFTDVDGVFTADPALVPDARKIPVLSYDEVLELSSVGAKVLQARSVEFAKKYRVPLVVRPTFNDGQGTLICEEVKDMEEIVVSGAALNTEEAKVTLWRVPDRPGVAARVFERLAAGAICVDMIVQNVSADGTTDVSFTVLRDDLRETARIAGDLVEEIGAKGTSVNDKIAKVSVVGVGMRTHTGIAAKMFKALADAKINIDMISTSEIKISVVVVESLGEKALRAVHKAFELEKGVVKRKKGR